MHAINDQGLAKSDQGIVEYFDLCTKDRVPLGKTGVRGIKPGADEYHLVVLAILVNREGRVLLTRRSARKIAGGLWECTAGSVQAGETSRKAIVREVKEEIGLDVEFTGEPITTYAEGAELFDIWTARIDNTLDDLVLQTAEVDAAMFATLDDIRQLIGSGEATVSLSEVVRLAETVIVPIR